MACMGLGDRCSQQVFLQSPMSREQPELSDQKSHLSLVVSMAV